MQLTRTILLLPFALLTAAIPEPTTSISDKQASKVLSDLEAYQTSLQAQPAYSDALSVLATAIPSSDLAAIEADYTGYFHSLATAVTPPSWYTALPTSYRQYISSIDAAENSIISKDIGGGAAAPTGIAKAGAAAVVGAGVGVVMAVL